MANPAVDHITTWFSQEQGRAGSAGREPSLLRAILAAYGRPYLSLGVLKAASDALNFAGPMLLNLLLRHLGGVQGASSAPLRLLGWEADVAAPAFGYACAALLAASLVLKVGRWRSRAAGKGAHLKITPASQALRRAPSRGSLLCVAAAPAALPPTAAPAGPPGGAVRLPTHAHQQPAALGCHRGCAAARTRLGFWELRQRQRAATPLHPGHVCCVRCGRSGGSLQRLDARTLHTDFNRLR